MYAKVIITAITRAWFRSSPWAAGAVMKTLRRPTGASVMVTCGLAVVHRVVVGAVGLVAAR
ncbi:MAG: hypothetical protein ACRDNW_05250 [Trebonia sp.]